MFYRLLFMFVFVFGLLPVSPAQALSVNNVRFGVHPDKTRMVMEMSDVSDFRVFVLEQPYRIVVDMPRFDWHAGAPVFAKNSVQQVRHGDLKDGISRIVFDVPRPVVLQNAFVLPRQGDKPARLVVDFYNAGATDFEAQKSKVLGTLEVEPLSASAARRSRDPRQAGSYQTASAGGMVPPPAREEPASPREKPLVVIDPGHGGVDPGALGHNGVHERDVVLKLGKELRDQLLAGGQYRVMMTRDSDTFIKLGDRVKFARQHGADLFVSIHADSIGKGNVRGASVYTLSEKASDAQTAKLAARENKADLIAGMDLSTEDQEVTNILVDLAMRDTMNQSKFFANKLVDHFHGRGVSLLDGPHRYAGFAVLKAPDIPSVLVEAGFMSNRKEAEQLNTPEYRRKIAAALKEGIDAYFRAVAENERS